MLRSSILATLTALFLWTSVPLKAADPPVPFNPGHFFARTPLTAEFEVYSGGITGDRIGAGYHSITRGDYGLRFTFGFMKGLNFSLNYLYSNQTRTLTAVTPAMGTLPAGTALMRAGNLNIFFGNGEFNLIRTKRAIFYLSPGVGFARNGARSLTLVTPLGTASSPIFPGTAVTFNLGTGVKFYPRKHFGIRVDVRDFLSGGGTGSFQTGSNQPFLQNTTQFFGPVPVQNNLVLTLGLIFRIL
jgi:opacity protein-like surface antigen